MNLKWAEKILNQLRGWGVETICLCPGGRNAPFVSLLAKPNPFEVISFFDERSAGFFACGRIKKEAKPVAVLTTSGTAVSELLSPVVEAWYSSLPLVVISADRPRRLRGSGAPQTIEQTGIFHKYIEREWDLEGEEEFEFRVGHLPVHINICFDEPLLDDKNRNPDFCHLGRLRSEEVPREAEIDCVAQGRALCVVGAIEPKEISAVEKFLENFDGPLFLEATSGLRNSQRLSRRVLTSGDSMVRKLLKSGAIDSVLRVGDVPLGRFWRDLDQMNTPVISFSDKSWAGKEKSQHYKMNYNQLEKLTWKNGVWSEPELSVVIEEDRQQKKRIVELCKKYPLSEAGLVYELQKRQNSVDSVYLGNSLPIRHWDLVSEGSVKTYFNRGANGIDGQLSSAFGAMDKKGSHWVLLGDLTTLYDFSAFWLSPWLRKNETHVNLFVLNNGGGQIFTRLFEEEMFVNRHDIKFTSLAEMWGWQHQSWKSGVEEISDEGLNLVEICPDPVQDKKFIEAFRSLWA